MPNLQTIRVPRYVLTYVLFRNQQDVQNKEDTYLFELKQTHEERNRSKSMVLSDSRNVNKTLFLLILVYCGYLCIYI